MLAPLPVFIDFLSSTGRARLEIVRNLKLRRGYDFYAGFVREVQAMHERAGTLRPEVAARELPALLVPTYAGDDGGDARKARIFPTLATAYRSEELV